MTVDLSRTVPVMGFDWDNNDMVMQTMLCRNHPELRWSSKNIWSRSLHYLTWETKECDCHLSMLSVILDESEDNVRTVGRTQSKHDEGQDLFPDNDDVKTLVVGGFTVAFPNDYPHSCSWFANMEKATDVKECLRNALVIGEAHPTTENFGRKIIVSLIRQMLVQNPYYKTTRLVQVIEAVVDTKPDRYGNTMFVTVIYNSEHNWAGAYAGKVDENGRVRWECYAD